MVVAVSILSSWSKFFLFLDDLVAGAQLLCWEFAVQL